MAGKFKTPVRARREEQKRTQKEIADIAGIDIRTYRDIEHCKQRGYNSDTLVYVARALEISPSELYDMIYNF